MPYFVLFAPLCEEHNKDILFNFVSFASLQGTSHMTCKTKQHVTASISTCNMIYIGLPVCAFLSPTYRNFLSKKQSRHSVFQTERYLNKS